MIGVGAIYVYGKQKIEAAARCRRIRSSTFRRARG